MALTVELGPVDKLKSIDLGKQGENLATTVEIDVSAWLEKWPAAAFYVLHKRRTDTIPYQVSGAVLEGDTLSWTLTNVDTAVSGSGKVEIIAVDGEVKAKSTTVDTVVEATLEAIGDGTESDLEAFLTETRENIARNTSSISTLSGKYDQLEQKQTEDYSTLMDAIGGVADELTYTTEEEVEALGWEEDS